METSRPNLFYWATSELSQDAFICWLLSWANCDEKEHYALRETALFFIQKLTDNQIKSIEKVDIIKQYKNIDILCKVNNEYAILIEDKINGSSYDGQLEKYYNLCSEEFPKEKIIPVYLKTRDQGDFKTVTKSGYKKFLRKDFLEVLNFGNNNGVDDSIFKDFYKHLCNIEVAVQSYKKLPISEWHWDSWKGFYNDLLIALGCGEWNYIPQKDGGFLGFYWNWVYKNYKGFEFESYLQLEQRKFCFKISPYKRENAQEIRSYYRGLLYAKAKEHNIAIYQNGRIGKSMTVAALNESYLKVNEDGILNFNETFKLCQKITQLVNEI